MRFRRPVEIKLEIYAFLSDDETCFHYIYADFLKSAQTAAAVRWVVVNDHDQGLCHAGIKNLLHPRSTPLHD